MRLPAKRGDIKRACMARPRKSLARECQHKVETGCYVDRAYVDYGAFLSDLPGVGPVYMDLLFERGCTASGGTGCAASEERGFAGAGTVHLTCP